jgi:hypothetical protein
MIIGRVIESPDFTDSTEQPPQTFEIDERTTGWVFSEGRFGSMDMSLLYTARDPLCARLRFYKPDGEPDTDWEFSRALLAWGYHEPAGEGSITFEPHDPRYLGMRINPPGDVDAYVYVSRLSVRLYLDQAYGLVPPEQEQAIIDTALDDWAEQEMHRTPQET